MNYLDLTIVDVTMKEKDTNYTLKATSSMRSSNFSENLTPNEAYLYIDIEALFKLKTALHAETLKDLEGKEVSLIQSPQSATYIQVDVYVDGNFTTFEGNVESSSQIPKNPLTIECYSCFSDGSLRLVKVGLHSTYTYYNSTYTYYRCTNDIFQTLHYLLGEEINKTIFFVDKEDKIYTSIYLPVTINYFI